MGQVLDWDRQEKGSSDAIDRALEQRHALLRLLCGDATGEMDGVDTGSQRFFTVFQYALSSEEKHIPSVFGDTPGVNEDSASHAAFLCKVRVLQLIIERVLGS